MTESTSGGTVIALRRLSKSFAGSAGGFRALSGIDLELDRGGLTLVVGPSGSGKSTLINLIAGIDRPSSGEVWVDGTALHDLGQDSLARFRGKHIGVVFQFFQLLPTMTVIENVMLPMDFVGTVAPDRRRARARELLALVGVAEQAAKLPATLSGGQQQRVAIARALANDPALLVADEPTGNLDSQTAIAVLELFAALAEAGKTVVLVTHATDVRVPFDRRVTLLDGKIAANEPGPRRTAGRA